MKQFPHIMFDKKLWNFLLLVLFFLSSTKVHNAQTKSNLEVLYSLTDSLVKKISDEIPADQNKILLELNLGQTYSVFSNNIRTGFIKNGFEVMNQPPDELNIPTVDIVIEGAGVEYGEIFRDGWFGTHYMPRHSALFGNYFQSFSGEGKIKFEFSIVDTVKVEDVKNLENESFPFTQADLPPEPFMSGIAEPLIAVVAAAAVIILFFSVRSK